jgi:hypothetical protein
VEFSTVAYDGANVAFVGGSGQSFEFDTIVSGVYKMVAADDESPIKVADTFTAVPGGVGNFLAFGHVAIDPDMAVFQGFSSTEPGFGPPTVTGLYTDAGGTLSKIVATGDTLGAKIVHSLNFGPGGFEDGQAVFVATFTDGSEALMMASMCSGIGFDGFADPIGGADATGGSVGDPVRAFKLKSTIPVKMVLTNCDGTPVITGVHTIEAIKWTDATSSDPAIVATPTDAATTGNAFRLADALTGEWHFNLDTKAAGLTRGTWQIVVTLSDGSMHNTFVALK